MRARRFRAGNNMNSIYRFATIQLQVFMLFGRSILNLRASIVICVLRWTEVLEFFHV